MSDNENSNPFVFVSHHVTLIAWIIFIILIVGGVFFVYRLFSGGGDIANGAAKILGDGIRFLDSLLDGCTKQGDCPKANDKSSCDNLGGCVWTPSTKSGDSGTCISKTTLKPGEGGPLTFKCNLFLLWFISTISTVGIGFLKFVAERSTSNKDVKDAAALEGKSVKDKLKETWGKVKEVSNKTIDQLKNWANKDMIEYTAKVAALQVSYDDYNKILNNTKMDEVTRAKASKESLDALVKAIDEAEAAGKKAKISDDDMKEMQDKVKENSESGPKAQPVLYAKILKNCNYHYNITNTKPSHAVMKYLITTASIVNTELSSKTQLNSTQKVNYFSLPMFNN
jgi:hypothetical protein